MQPESLASARHLTLNVLQKEHAGHGSPVDQSVKTKITKIATWATLLVGSFIAAKISIGLRRALKHPNPEMWE